MIEEAISKNTEALNRLAAAIERYTKGVSAIGAPAPIATETPAPAKPDELPAEAATAPALEAPKPSRGRPKKEAEPTAATPAEAPVAEAPAPAPATKVTQVISAADLKVFVKAEFHNKNNRDGYLKVCNEVFGGKVSVDAMDEAQRAKLHAALKAALAASMEI